jgi:cardiolipin synthase
MELRPFTIPNLLTVARLVSLPFLLHAIRQGSHGAALGIFLAASLTDIIDGYIARRFQQGSRIGAILDPIADKLFCLSTLTIFAFPSTPSAIRVPVLLLALVYVRDVLMVIAGLVLYFIYHVRDFPPLPLGKATTFFEIATVVAILLNNLHAMWPWVAVGGFWLIGICTFASGIQYVARVRNLPRS